MSSRNDKSNLKSWLELDDNNLLVKQSHTYDSLNRVSSEHKTTVDTGIGGLSILREYTYDINGNPVGGTPVFSEWTILQESNQSSLSSVLSINSLLKQGGSLTAGLDYDNILYSYPSGSSESIDYKLGSLVVRNVLITYLSNAKIDISTVSIT